MPIPVSCSGCKKRFNAPDRGAGKKVPCPACKTIIEIPAAEPDDDDDYKLADLPPPGPSPVKVPTTRPPSGSSVSTGGQPRQDRLPPSSPAASPVAASQSRRAWIPPTKSSTPTWLRHLHWCLALAMIPLAVSIFGPDRAEAEPDVEFATPSTPDASSPLPTSEPTSAEDEARVAEALEQMSVDDLFAVLPDQKLPGAFLARNSHMHWLFALFTAAAYMTFLVFLASDKSAQPLHLLGVGLFTATGGILLLLFVQMASMIGVVRVRGAGALIVLVLALIGLSYRAALDPDSGLIASFIGFTAAVGLCEEVCKALPILIYYRVGNQQSWRGAFLWGLASGTGFGVSEAIMYSQDFYNGIQGPGIYVVRFVSCVALHAIWAGSIGISIHQNQELLQEDLDEWWWYALAVLRLIAVPMVLHGLYDTLLKKDLEFLALLTAAASFGYLAWQISHLRGSDDQDERAAYVASYIRAKSAAQGA